MVRSVGIKVILFGIALSASCSVDTSDNAPGTGGEFAAGGSGAGGSSGLGAGGQGGLGTGSNGAGSGVGGVGVAISGGAGGAVEGGGVGQGGVGQGGVGQGGAVEGGGAGQGGGGTGGAGHDGAGQGGANAPTAGSGGSIDGGGTGGEAGSACDEQGAPPDWTLGGTPEVDDPRWQEASGIDFQDFTASGAIAARSRLLDDAGTLFLQLRVLRDVTPGNVTPGNFGVSHYRDSVYVAFADATLMTIQVVRVAIDGAGATHGIRWMKSNGVWSVALATAGSLPWLSAFTAWVNPTVSGSEGVSWAVNFKLATASAPGQKLWYGVTVSPNGAVGPQIYAWPNRGGFVEPNPPDTGEVATTWGQQFDAIAIGAANWGDYSASLGRRCAQDQTQ